nr:heparin lyase I family protein [Stenotrophomonas geniculata]
MIDLPPPSAPVAYRSASAAPEHLSNALYNVQSAHQPWSVQIDSKSDRVRFETRPGDRFGSEIGRSRSELQSTTKQSAQGKAVWVTYRVRVSVSPKIVSDSMVIGQFHQTEDKGDLSGYPPFELNLKADGLYVYTATVASPVTSRFYPQKRIAGPVTFQLESWHTVAINVRFGWQSDACLRVWLDDKLIASATGVSMGMNDAVGPYWKYGIYYRPDTADQTVVAEYQGLSIGPVPPAGSAGDTLSGGSTCD